MQDKKTEAMELEHNAVKPADGELKTQLERTPEDYKRGELPKAE